MRLIRNIRPGIDRLIFCFPLVCADGKINTLVKFMSHLECIRIPAVIDSMLVFEAESGYFDKTLVFRNSKDYMPEKDKNYQWITASVLNDPGDQVIYLRKR